MIGISTNGGPTTKSGGITATVTSADETTVRDCALGQAEAFEIETDAPSSRMARGVLATVPPPAPSDNPPASIEARRFLERIVVWPGSQGPGWINLHVHSKNRDPSKNDGKDWVIGWPFKTVDDFISRAKWTESIDNFYDCWFCTSQQSQIGTGRTGKPKAVRLQRNATVLKAIWADIDVKPDDPERHYTTLQEAWAAVSGFIRKVGLPEPSALVNSGGGWHVYWISELPLTRDAWMPYADGLKQLLLQEGIKCDSGLTTDAARILRVPGTLNHKYNPPRPVQLVHLGATYNFPQALGFLTKVAPTSPQQSTTTPADVIDAAFTATAPDPAFEALAPASNDLSAGIEFVGSDKLLDPRPIFAQCGFLRTAIATGGRDYDNPLWNLSVLCTAFMENGNAFAHEVSKGHASYTLADTQALFDRKVRERAERNLGYPSCAAIESAGCKACKTCPLRYKSKSPLNLVRDLDILVGPNFVNPYDEFAGPPFPLEILSPTVRKLVDALSRAMGADPSAIAMTGLTVLSGAINAETSVRLGDGWWEKPIIWSLLVGPPSSMKSPIIDKVTKPLRQIDNERSKRWQQEHKLWLQKKETSKNILPPPKLPRCLINDATPEKVAEILSRAPSGALMVHDELAGWMSNFERYNSGSSRAFYLTCWNGGTFTKDRVGTGRNDLNAEICVENLALSILGGVQPDRLVKLGDLTEDGLLQRFLPVLMTAANLGDPYAPVTAAEFTFERLIRSINEAPPQQFEFDEDAFDVRDHLMRYLHELEKVDGFAAPLLGAIGKLKGYFGRLCLILQVAQNHDPQPASNADASAFAPDVAALVETLMGLAPDNSLSAGINWSQLITRRTAEQATKLIRQFLLPHVFGFYDVVVNGGAERERVRDLADFVLSSKKDRLRPSDFTAGVRSLRGQPDTRLREWVGRLCAMDWLTPEDGKPGAPIKAWHVAPGLREHFAGRCKQVQAARAEAHKILKAGGSRGRV